MTQRSGEETEVVEGEVRLGTKIGWLVEPRGDTEGREGNQGGLVLLHHSTDRTDSYRIFCQTQPPRYLVTRRKLSEDWGLPSCVNRGSGRGPPNGRTVKVTTGETWKLTSDVGEGGGECRSRVGTTESSSKESHFTSPHFETDEESQVPYGFC